MEKEPRSVLPAAEGGRSFSWHPDRLALGDGGPAGAGEGPGLGRAAVLLMCPCQVLLSHNPHFLAPCSSCSKNPGLRTTCSWLACGVSECATMVSGSRDVCPHCDQVCRVLGLTSNNICN